MKASAKMLSVVVGLLLLLFSVTMAAGAPMLGSGVIKYDPNAPVNGGKNISISVWTWAYVPWINEVTAAYMKVHPNVKMTVEVSPWADYFKKVPVALQAGTGPDVFMPHSEYESVIVPNMAPYSEGGLTVEDLKKDFRTVDNHIIDGKVYWIDLGSIMGCVLYNKDMWAAAGLTEKDNPKTWDQLIQVAKKLTKKDASGTIRVQGLSFNGQFFDAWKDMMYQQGQWLFDQTGTKPRINVPAGKKAAQLLYDMYHKYGLGDIKFPGADTALGNGTAAMIYTWSWIAPGLDQNFPDLKYGYFDIPTFTAGTPPAYGRQNGEANFGVPEKSKPEVKKVVFDFVKFALANDDMLVRYNTLQHNAPTKYALYKNPAMQKDPLIKGQINVIDRMVYPGAMPDAYQVGLQKYLEDAIYVNDQGLDSALATAESVITKDMVGQSFIYYERGYKYAKEFSK
jgi:multiple sugar transport system substrate-binding protein